MDSSCCYIRISPTQNGKHYVAMIYCNDLYLWCTLLLIEITFVIAEKSLKLSLDIHIVYHSFKHCGNASLISRNEFLL